MERSDRLKTITARATVTASRYSRVLAAGNVARSGKLGSDLYPQEYRKVCKNTVPSAAAPATTSPASVSQNFTGDRRTPVPESYWMSSATSSVTADTRT